MEQRGSAPSTSEWFLIASRGDMVVRIRPGMLLGETVAGDVTFFNPSCAQVELNIAYDGSAVLNAVDDYELVSAGGARSCRERLERHRRAKIRLPHNVLQLDTDFANPTKADDAVEIRVALKPLIPRQNPRPTPQRPAERTGVRRQPTFNPVMAASVGLAAIGLALLYPQIRESQISDPPATAEAVRSTQTDPAQTAGLAIEVPAGGSEVALTTIRLPPLPLRILELPTAETTEIEPSETKPAPTFVAALEQTGEPAQALAQAPAQRRDPLAADRATAPAPESPESPETSIPLQSVHQQLINRSLAQLAGGQLGDARSSLQAAADAGADPKLITDLYAEIDYRQRLTEGLSE